MAETVADVFQGLLARGFSPVQAAAVAGNIQQESNFNPGAINADEDAHGLIQWRGPRLQALREFAASRGTHYADQNTQLDFIRHEMGGTERRAGDQFLATQDLPSANRALKGYIRYGDDSEGTRLTNANRFLGGPQSGPYVGNQTFAPQVPSQEATGSQPGTISELFSHIQTPAPQFAATTRGSQSPVVDNESAVNAYLDDSAQQKLFSPRTTGIVKKRHV